MMCLRRPVTIWCNATPAQILNYFQAIQSLIFWNNFKPMLMRASKILATTDSTAADSNSIHPFQVLLDSKSPGESQHTNVLAHSGIASRDDNAGQTLIGTKECGRAHQALVSDVKQYGHKDVHMYHACPHNPVSLATIHLRPDVRMTSAHQTARYHPSCMLALLFIHGIHVCK